MLRRLYFLHFLIVPATVAVVGYLLWPDSSVLRLLTIAVAALLAAFVSMRVVRRLDNRLALRMTRQTQAMAEGGPRLRLYGGATPPMRTLARTFNEMCDRLTERFSRLEDDRDRLRAVLGGMVEGVIALDADDAIIFANERAGQLLDFVPQRTEGRKFWEVFRQRTWQQLVSTAVASREPQRAELEWTGSTPRSVAVYAAPLPGSALAGLIVVIHDVSELRRLERLRQEFVANVSHELKTPLAVMKACVESLMDGAAEDPKHRTAFLQQIADQADRLHELILDLLKIASVESGGQEFSPATIPLASAVRECLARHQARADAKRVKLIANPPPSEENIAVWADADALESILDNLLDNAIKYTPEGGQVEVRWLGGPAQASLEVADTGIGIPEADLPRVFERFFRVDKARAREVGGTGLGLSIVKHLAQAMNGSVSARSLLGQGSVFTVKLPMAL